MSKAFLAVNMLQETYQLRGSSSLRDYSLGYYDGVAYYWLCIQQYASYHITDMSKFLLSLECCKGNRPRTLNKFSFQGQKGSTLANNI